MPLQSITIDTGNNPDIAIVWLHGLGADGHDFVPIIKQMSFPENISIRFIFPHAPMRAVTINNNAVMRAWYDIVDMRIDAKQDEEGILQSSSSVSALIDETIRSGIKQNNIFLAGFSQGGAIALYNGLTGKHKLAGVIALSTYIPLISKIKIKNQVNIFYGHGEFDPVIPIQLAQMSGQWLRDNNIVPVWHKYPMQHQVIEQEIIDIQNWLISRIADINSFD